MSNFYKISFKDENNVHYRNVTMNSSWLSFYRLAHLTISEEVKKGNNFSEISIYRDGVLLSDYSHALTNAGIRESRDTEQALILNTW